MNEGFQMSKKKRTY